MADMIDLFLFGDDFDAVLEILDGEEIDEHFEEAADEVQLESIVCQHCKQKCKSKSGLKRHITVKHKVIEKEDQGKRQSYLTVETYSRIVEKAKLKLCDCKMYPQLKREEIKSYNCNITSEFFEIQNLYNRLVNSGKR